MKKHFHLPLHMQISENDAKHIAKTLIKVSEEIIYS